MSAASKTSISRQALKAWGFTVCAAVLVWSVTGLLAANAQIASAPAAKAVQAAVPDASSGPTWQSLSPAQQTALSPLAAQWQGMSVLQRQKWLEVSKNHATLPAAEQAKLHTRMGDWAKLSPKERANARQNFAENQALTSGLTTDQRSAQWQAYQLLSPEEKSKLAASSMPKPAPGPATVLRPANPLQSSPPAQFGTAKALALQDEQAKLQPSKISIAPHLQKGTGPMPLKPLNASKSTAVLADSADNAK
jgi:Protein of unknown function (DUF3106)